MTRLTEYQRPLSEAGAIASPVAPLARSDHEMWLRSFIRRLGHCGQCRQQLVLVSVIAVLFVVVGTINPMFLSGSNIANIFAGNAYIAVAAIGMSLVIICGHIDVSVGALIGVLAMVSGSLAVRGYPAWVAWSVPVIVGALWNAGVGALIAYGRIPSIVVTLGMFSILKGGLIGVTGGVWLSNLPASFLLAQFMFLGIPTTVWFMIAFSLLAAVWMRMSFLGRAFYAVGSNFEAANVVGIHTSRTVVLAFAVHGAFAGISAILFATQMQVIQTTVPANLELTIIAAAVVGGVSILGGRGSVIGSTLAAIFFATVSASLIFLDISAHWLRASQALLILSAVLIDLASRRRIR